MFKPIIQAGDPHAFLAESQQGVNERSTSDCGRQILAVTDFAGLKRRVMEPKCNLT